MKQIKISFVLVMMLIGAVVAIAVLVSPTYAQDLFSLRRDANSGVKITRLPDGTTIAEHSDSTVVIKFANTLEMTLSPDSWVTVAGSKNPVRVQRSAMERGEMSDGTIVSPLMDGSVRIDLAEGSVILVAPDNHVTTGRSRPPTDPAESPLRQAVLCTFTPYNTVNLRSGPGANYDRIDTLAGGEDVGVIGQATGDDGYIWWEVGDSIYVRSDLGDSDCDPVCGNDVCEYAETEASCAADCGGGTGGGGTGTSSTASTNDTALVSTGDGCYVDSCQNCYESVSCWPDCNECTCSLNAFGCVTCYCTTPATGGGGADDSAADTSSGCDFATCEDCIAAFPCFPDPCTQTECSLNEFGCPVCSTAP